MSVEFFTTADAVGGIIELDEEIDLTPFIETAHNIIERTCLDSDYDDATLELIERWLSAHFYAIRDPRTIAEAVKGISERYESGISGSAKGTGFSLTRYGRQAMLLDTDGNLAALDNIVTMGGRIKGSITHIGTNYDPVW
jgi:hypothetical protein